MSISRSQLESSFKRQLSLYKKYKASGSDSDRERWHKANDLWKKKLNSFLSSLDPRSRQENIDYYNDRMRKSNPRTAAMKRSANPRSKAGSKWGVYCRGTLAYVSSAKPDCTKAKTKLKRAGFGVCTVKKVGPNPVSGKVPVVGWRTQFKKASRAVGVVRRNPSIRRGPGFIRASHVGKSFGSLPGVRRSDASSFGTVQAIDVGKSYYVRDGIFQMENNEQRDKRLKRNPGPTRGISSRAVSGRMGRKISQFSPSRKYGGRSAGIGTRAVVKGGRLRNPVDFGGAYPKTKIGLMKAIKTAIKKYHHAKMHGTGTAAQWSERRYNLQEELWKKFGVNTQITDGGHKAIFFEGMTPPEYRKSNPRRRNAASILRRRSNPRLTDHEARSILSDLGIGVNDDVHTLSSSTMDRVVDAAQKYGYRKPKTASGSTGRYFVEHLQRKARPRAFSGYRGTRNPHWAVNPRKGYVVQVGNSVAWVGKLASDATKVIRKLMAAGFKSVKGFEAKLLGAKPGWRKQYVKASRSTTARRSNPGGKGKGPYFVYRDDGREYTKGKGIGSKSQAVKMAQLAASANINRSNTIITVKDSGGGVVAKYRATYFGPEKMSNPSLAAKGRRRRNPMYEAFYSTGGHTGPFHTMAEAVAFAKQAIAGNANEKWIKIKPYSSGGVSGYGPTVATIVVSR